jgi:hypothetical protein
MRGGRVWLVIGWSFATSCKEAKPDHVDGFVPGDRAEGYLDLNYPDYSDVHTEYTDGYTDMYVDYADYYYDGYGDSYGDSYYTDGSYYTDYYTWYTDYYGYHSGYESGGPTGDTGEGSEVDTLLPGDLVITEIMHNPAAVADTSGEWFEILNTTLLPVDLDGLVVRDGTGTEQFVVAGSLLIASGARAVFGVEQDPALNGGVIIDIAYLASDLALANGADELVLENAGGVLDAVAYDDGVTFPDQDGASMSLEPALTDAVANDAGAAWCAGALLYGAGDLGTPGEPNPSCTQRGSGDTGLGGAPADDIVAGELVITEIMNNPAAVLDTQGEWFELLNVGTRTLDLDGLQISNAAATESFVVSGTLLVGAGQYVVLGVQDDPAQNGGVTVDYEYAGFSLGNGADEIVVQNAGGELDTVAWDGGVTFPSPSGASLSLDPTLSSPSSNDLGTSWCETTTAWSAGDLGTPGAANDPC